MALTVGTVGAGSGGKYLTDQVAPGKDDFAELSPAQMLAYYSDTKAHGESPGRWLGRGLPTLDLAGPVAAKELENLIGHARHPHFEALLDAAAATIRHSDLEAVEQVKALKQAARELELGRRFATYESAKGRAERAVKDLGEDADEASKDAVRAAVLAEGDRRAVAGYELTFTPVKSVSILAALGGERLWTQVMEAHRVAVDQALEYVQDHAAFSRTGVDGVRQVDTDGLIIAAFEHRMSREKDPNIHTHAIVANRVRCVDGGWRTVDGRAIYAASVGARALYEQALEAELAVQLGVEFSLDERKTIREITGVPLSLIQQFSKRRAAIEHALGANVAGKIAPKVWAKLARRYSLSTRTPKAGAESTADALHRWQAEMRAAGVDITGLRSTVLNPTKQRDPDTRTDKDILDVALGLLTDIRAVWTRHHAILALARVLPLPHGGDYTRHHERLERLADRLLAGQNVQQVTPPELLTVGPTLRRGSDGQSVFTAHLDVRYAASSTVEQERRLLNTARHDSAGKALPAHVLDQHIGAASLGEDQAAAVRDILGSGRRMSALVGPAGTGKTYLQRFIAGTWTAHGGRVLALAPSQIAAGVLGETIGAPADNVAKWLHEHDKIRPGAVGRLATKPGLATGSQYELTAEHLVILDEAGMVTTRDLDAILTAVTKAGARLLLVGDHKQLPSIGAGGMFGTIAEITNAPVLATVRRFRDTNGQLREWECAASLQLRDRDPAAVAEYERRGRLHSGPAERMHDTAYRAWLTDHLAFEAAGNGEVALLMADTEAAAADLSVRARADLVRRGLVQAEGSTLSDGTIASVGDLIVTRLNERRIRADDGEGFIANRDTWRVVEHDEDGSLTVQAVTGKKRRLTLPPDYVAANVQLAYAGTVHSAQGRTVATARGIVTDATSAEALYVMLTRGQRSNDVYITTEKDDAEAHQQTPHQHALSVLAGILERDEAPNLSVTDTEADLYDQATSLARLRTVFGDLSAVIAGATHARIIADLVGHTAADRALTDPAWPSLVRLLADASAAGWDAPTLLTTAIGQRELGTAADVAAVLHWRCTGIIGNSAPTTAGAHTTVVAAESWQERAAALTSDTGPAGSDPVVTDAADALTQAAALMDRRTDTLADRLAEAVAQPHPPTWLNALGPLPETGPRRDDWLARARVAASYQDATGYQPVGDDPIGPRPPAGDIGARRLFDAARASLAEVPIAVSMRAMLPDRLRDYVKAGINAETHGQPPYVGHELRQLSLHARAQRTRVNRLRQENQKAAGQLATADKRRLRRDQAAIDSLTRTHAAAAHRLDTAENRLRQIETQLAEATAMHEHWQHWEQHTTEIRAAARLATQELSLRGLPPADEQLPLDHTATAEPVIDPEPLYAVMAAAARYYQQHLDQRWAGTYLASRKLDAVARAAGAGYAPSRPGQWTLLLDHLRAAGHTDHAITTAGLAVPSRHGQLIDRFRDRVVFPILDEQDRPIGFMGRKPTSDRNPDNPKYLNLATTPIYDKSAVFYGLDQAAIDRLHNGATAIVIEGPTDVLAVRATNSDLIPIATCGTALTDQHLNQLAQHTDLDTVVWAFDGDTAGQNAARAAGKKLEQRGVHPAQAQTLIFDNGKDPADILTDQHPDQLRTLIEDPQQRGQILDLIVDDNLNQWETYDHELADLPIRDHAAHEAATLLLDLDNPADITRQIGRITARTGVDAGALSTYLTEIRFPDREPEIDAEPGTGDVEASADRDVLNEPDPRA